MTTTSTDPIADMLSRVRNAIAVRKTEVSLPHSKIKESAAGLLKQNNFIRDVKVSDAEVGKQLTITINSPDQNAKINEITRMSTPGRRQYVNAAGIPTIKQGRGLIIISTSHGLMSGNDAKAKGIGGELICKVY